MSDLIETVPRMDLSVQDIEHLVEELRAYHAIYSPLFQRREQREAASTSLQELLATLPRKSIEPMVLAANPTAFTERSKVIATGEEIHLYGLPTKDSNRKTKYYDVTITLDVLETGKPAATATVMSVRSPGVRPSEFVPGVYTAPANYETTCTLTASAFAGRTEFDLHCLYDVDPGQTFAATWYTGLIAGHPLEPQLSAAKLDTLPNNEEFAWGRVGFTGNSTWLGGCFNDRELFAVRQVDDTLTLTNYGSDINFDCQISLGKSAP